MIIMSVDLGKVRTGIAISDKNEFLASPLCVIKETKRDMLAMKIDVLARDNNVKQIVLGLPKNMDGSEGESAINAREFKTLLEEKTGLDVIMRDERGTTITAHNYLNVTDVRGRKRKSIVDSVAATVILQDYLDYRKNQSINKQ